MIACTGAEIIAKLLSRQGITMVSGIPGGSTLPLHDALAKSDIEHVLARHEQGAGFIAAGMARTTGQPQVCLATSGPGATNLLTALADCHADGVPIICLTGQVDRRFIGSQAFQEVDTCALGRPIAKKTYFAHKATDLLRILPEAFSLAASGRPGPVLVTIPRDVQMETAQVEHWPEPGQPAAAARLDEGALTEAIALIRQSKRPLLIVGAGCASPRAALLAKTLCEQAGIPAVSTLLGRSVLAHDHPLHLGMIGMHGAVLANRAMHEADCLVVVGARLADRSIGHPEGFAKKASIVRIDIEKRADKHLKAAEVFLQAEASEALRHLIDRLSTQARTPWLAHLEHPDAHFDEEAPRELLHAVGQAVGEQAIIVTDVGQHQMWTAVHYPFARAGSFLTSGGLGTMGFGLPAAIGASLAEPNRKVVLVTGDGSLSMNIQELATLAETGANVSVIVMDNGALGLVRQQQDLLFRGRRSHSCLKHRIDFAAVARAFGVEGIDAESFDDPLQAVIEAVTKDGPQLVRVPVGLEHMALPLTMPGKHYSEAIVPTPGRLAAQERI